MYFYVYYVYPTYLIYYALASLESTTQRTLYTDSRRIHNATPPYLLYIALYTILFVTICAHSPTDGLTTIPHSILYILNLYSIFYICILHSIFYTLHFVFYVLCYFALLCILP